MDFTPKYFDPVKAGGTRVDGHGSVSFRSGESPEDVYVYSPRTILALNVVLATRRPLLISGEPGSGKSMLAKNAAALLGCWYYKDTVTSRTQASDLLWTFDTLRRLSDAQTSGQELLPKRYYVEPGTLWWAFDPESAEQRGVDEVPEQYKQHLAIDPGMSPRRRRSEKAVVLLDEIDKADPDVPNDLLEPFDLKSFTVRETNARITAKRDTLLILTTNGERELPQAFLRRCVALTLDAPNEDWFVSIANQKFGVNDESLHREVAREVMRHREAAKKARLRQPSTGEYLDALEVCRDLRIDTSSTIWTEVARSVLWKNERTPELEPAARVPS
jgi:MoxR-like ATPase